MNTVKKKKILFIVQNFSYCNFKFYTLQKKNTPEQGKDNT